MHHAIVRKPGKSYVRALQDWYCKNNGETSDPDPERAVWQHDQYIASLAQLDVAVHELPVDERFPDGCFTQDPVLVYNGSALELNARMLSRKGESEAVVGHLIQQGYEVNKMSDGHCDGGDVMIATDLKRVWIGLSSRTDEMGFNNVKQFYTARGFRVDPIPVVNCLHLITGASYIGGGNFLVSDLVETKEYLKNEGYEVLYVPPEESYAVNVVSIGKTIIMPEGYPFTQKSIERAGYSVLAIPMSEFEKADGSMTCLSSLFEV